MMENACEYKNSASWIKEAMGICRRSNVIHCKDCGKTTDHLYGDGTGKYTALCERCHKKRDILQKIDVAIKNERRKK